MQVYITKKINLFKKIIIPETKWPHFVNKYTAARSTGSPINCTKPCKTFFKTKDSI